MASSGTPPQRADNVLLQTFRTGHAVRELMEHAVAGTGVSADEWAVLSAVGLFRSVAPTQLATVLRVPPTSISRYVARLAGSDLVVRVPNEADRRARPEGTDPHAPAPKASPHGCLPTLICRPTTRLVLGSTRVHPTTGKRRRIVIGGTPWDVAFHDGSLWATSSSAGAVVRVDPRTNRVVARIVTGGTPANLTAAFGSLWAGSATGTAVFRIDTKSNTVTRVETGGEGPGSVEPVGDALWVSQQGSNTVAKIDPETGELLATVPVGTAPAWLADAGDGTLLVPNARDDTVTRVDTVTNRAIQTIRVGGGPAVFRRAFGDLWLTHLRGVLWRLQVG